MLGKMNQQPVVVIGAGEMSALAVRAFHARGAKNLTVVNRTYANAARLAQQYGYRALAWNGLDDALVHSEVVVSATGAQEPVLSTEWVQEIMRRRSAYPLLLLDIALPRDIAPASREVPGVTLVDLDDIKQRLNHTMNQRQNEAQQVEVIVQEELSAFAHWMNVIPTVGKLHRKAEQIRQQEVERALQHLPDLDPKVQEQIEMLTRSLVKKLLHEPSHRMRNDVKNGELSKHTSSLHFLFGLDEDDLSTRERRESGNHD
jgi:glutamyl-tRNA reductase